MPGIGKSQLALAYDQQEFLSSTYDLIVWLSGTTCDKIVEGLTDALVLLEHPARAETDVKARSNAFQRTSPQGGVDCYDLRRVRGSRRTARQEDYFDGLI